MSARYAIYLTPPVDHPLWQSGCTWLGRDPSGDEAPAAPARRAAPWRYGFHATLKTPMRLAEGCSLQSLHQALCALVRTVAPFDMPALEVGLFEDLIVLQPAGPLAEAHPLRDLADRCITELDVFREPATPSDLARWRVRAPLDDEQQALLSRWGCPHVLERWHFHCTLSDLIPDEGERAVWLELARTFFAPALEQPWRCDALSLFVEPSVGAPLQLLRRYALSGQAPLRS
ncbi:MAG: DUF1045 domain-containing protein [Sphaerotilus natans]|jgi:hypothetical protein|uniref:DUF1045 domain-containing protein n=1 Tax=Sphaerotilus sulfidivorans TaxID=639200 RepID=UPI0023557D88|nr:DUF1045 domain-containing protein [Sphaerotilus sulfidivorans]MCK6404057.1 DUF1045 domain-containing protein [Sphaerotilus sulfidivorans]